MEFTYNAYRSLLKHLGVHGFTFVDYHNWGKEEKCVILRHDIDNDLDKAVELARIEHEAGVRSTYFVLLVSDFYNIFSKRNKSKLEEIVQHGHEIGLHFDEQKYFGCSMEEMRECILKEVAVLQDVIGMPIRAVSMHRPSKEMLEADLKIPGIVNSYSQVFFKQFKYLSDSRRCWREPVEEIIDSEKRLHILTHAFWYAETESNLHDTVADFVNSANKQRYCFFMENITALEAIMRMEEVR